jgi:hypothetical protein
MIHRFLYGAAGEDDKKDDGQERAADKSKRKALRDLASETGFDNMTDLKEFIDSKKKAEDDALDEQTKALQEAERVKKEYEAQMSDLADERLALRISQAVLAAGVSDPKRSDRISALVRLDLEPDLSEDDWNEAITDSLQSVTEDMPELFKGPAGMGSGDGGSKGKSKEDGDEQEAFEKQLREEALARGLVQFPG